MSASRPAVRGVTIHDVARHAGVSHQTVSRVINQHANVAAGTRERVLQAIEALKYRPNIMAKSLATNRSQLIGMVAYGTEQYGPAQVVRNVERSARSHGYEIILVTLSQFSSDEMVTAIGRLQQFGVDGVVMFTPYDAHGLIGRLDPALPVIMIDAATTAGGTTVSIDQLEGGAAATEYLIGLGHRRILHIGGPLEWSDAALRYQGYLQAMQRRGLPPLPKVDGDWSPVSGFQAVMEADRLNLDFTGITAANDQMALGALRALRTLGRPVPGQVSVVGFDDMPEAAFYEPPLTTLVQDFALLGRRSLDELIRMMKQPDEQGRHVVFQPVLKVRESSGPAPR